MSTKQKQGWLVLGGGIAAAAGVFGTWSRPPAALGLDFSEPGTTVFHGQGTLALGVLLIVLGVIITFRKPSPNDLYYRPLSGATILFSLLATYLVINYAFLLAGTRQEVAGPAVVDVVEIHTGWGEGMSLLGIAVALVGGVWTWNTGHRNWQISQQRVGSTASLGETTT